MEPLYRHAMRMTNNAPDVEDLLHTAGQHDSDAALDQSTGVNRIRK